jgi:GTP-binding protein
MPVAKFIKSAVWEEDFPPEAQVEIALAGRSNAGKSSLINTLTNHRIAKVSSTPGKTRLLNFFEIDGGKYNIVDMPGYGYASRSKSEVTEWQQMIEEYMMYRKSLRGLLLVMDVRRDWTDEEEMLKAFAQSYDFGFAVVATKVDQLTKQQLSLALAKLKKAAQTNDVFPCSSLKKTGLKELEEWYFQNWVRNRKRAAQT